jgi:hypothetical protein
MVFLKSLKEVEIPATAASINNALTSDSLVMADCGSGRHLVLGGVQEGQDGVSVNTTYGRQHVERVTVFVGRG